MATKLEAQTARDVIKATHPIVKNPAFVGITTAQAAPYSADYVVVIMLKSPQTPEMEIPSHLDGVGIAVHHVKTQPVQEKKGDKT